MPDGRVSLLALDLHVHAGIERWGRPLAAFLDALRSRGVRLAGLLDHSEFYVEQKPDWILGVLAEQKKAGVTAYPGDLAGLRAFYADLDSIAGSAEPRFLKGLEVKGIRLTPDAFFEFPDYLANCVDALEREQGTTFAERLASRIRRFGEKIRHTGKPGIIHHPFRPLVAPYKELVASGAAPPPEAFLPAADLARIIDAAGEYGLFIEVNLSTLAAAEESERLLGLFVYLVRSLVEAKVDLSFGSDSHEPPQPTIAPGALRVLRESGLGPERLDRVVRVLGARPEDVFSSAGHSRRIPYARP